MTTPTITLFPDTLPAKGQANAPFDTNVDDFLSWLTATNGPELATFITWTVGVRDTVLATALAGDLPPLTGEATKFLRVNAAEDGAEFRTPAEVLGDIGATAALALKAPLASPDLTGVPTVPTAALATNTTQAASTAFVVAEIAEEAGRYTSASGNTSWLSTLVTEAHGKGVQPFMFAAYIQCVSTEGGWAVGDRIHLGQYENGGIGAMGASDATNLYWRAGSGQRLFIKGTGGVFSPTQAKWELYFKALF